jgi:hypothetical protein
MQAFALSGAEFWHESDLRKSAPVLLSLFAVRLDCLRRNAWLEQFCVSLEEGLLRYWWVFAG